MVSVRFLATLEMTTLLRCFLNALPEIMDKEE